MVDPLWSSGAIRESTNDVIIFISGRIIEIYQLSHTRFKGEYRVGVLRMDLEI
jgi:hypothetical protein